MASVSHPPFIKNRRTQKFILLIIFVPCNSLGACAPNRQSSGKWGLLITLGLRDPSEPLPSCSFAASSRADGVYLSLCPQLLTEGL